MPTVAGLPRDRVSERRRAVALAHYYRGVEGLTIRQIAGRLGRAPATIKGYFYDPTGEKARRSRLATRGCAAAAAHTRSHGTARATPTRTARPATRARSSDAGRAKACVTRCARGAPATGGCPPRMTGRALTLGAGDARRSSDWTKATGLRRASSRTSSGRGPQRGQLRGKARPCRVASWMPGQTMMEPSAASGLLAGLSNRVQPPAGLRGRCGAWPVCMVNA
jgi:hypothetical protein